MAVLGWVLGTLAVVVPIAVYVLERRIQAVHFAVLASRPLLTGDSRFPLEVSFDGAPVMEPRVMVLRITNAGNQPIRPEDYEEPLRLSVLGARIVSSDITFARPADFAPSIVERSDSQIALSRFLMNPRDLVEVQLLVDGEPTETRVTGRLAGVPTIERVRLPRTPTGELEEMSRKELFLVALMAAGMTAFSLVLLLNGTIWGRYLGRHSFAFLPSISLCRFAKHSGATGCFSGSGGGMLLDVRNDLRRTNFDVSPNTLRQMTMARRSTPAR